MSVDINNKRVHLQQKNCRPKMDCKNLSAFRIQILNESTRNSIYGAFGQGEITDYKAQKWTQKAFKKKKTIHLKI